MELNPIAAFSGSSGTSRLATLLARIVDCCLCAAVFLVPLWFLPFTLDVLELNKQTLLVVLSMVALIAWLGKGVVEKRLTFSRSWLHIVVAIFLVGYFVTSLFSQDRYLSLVGNFGQMQWAFTSVAAFVVFYFLVVNTVKGTTKLYHLILTFLASSSLVGLYGLLQMLNVQLFTGILPVSADKSFNTIGSVNSLALFMAIPLIISASLMVLGCKDEKCVLGRPGKGSVIAKALVWFTLIVSLLIAVAVDFWVTWATILFGTLLLVGITTLRTRATHLRKATAIVPGILCLVSVVLLIWATPFKLGLPAEVSPSMSHSWQIAQQTLQDKPLFGSGPGTWIYDYSQYRSSSVNLTPFWTNRFERGISTSFTLLAMVGIVGMSLWLLLILSAVVKSAMHLTRERDDDEWQAYLTVFAGWATTAFIAFFYNYNFSHHFVFWFLLALLASLVAKGTYTFDGQRNAWSTTLLSVKFIVLTVAAISVAWLAGQRLVADAQYSSAVSAFRNGKPIQQSIDRLNSAVALNRLNDVYYRNLSQAYLIRVSQETQQQPDQDRTNLVNTLVSASIDSAKKATELSPGNVDNWSNLAVVYQAIASFTRGADEFAIQNFQEALKREPTNPSFYNEIGKLYILRSDAYRTLLTSKDDKVSKEAEANVRAELDKAAEKLNQAIQVKADYAPAHYNLGILYERQNRLKDAIVKLEQVLGVNNKDIGVGFQLAILYYRNGDKDKATNLFQQIVALEPSYANARWYLSALLEEQGKLDDAIAQVQKIQETNQDNQLVAQRLQQLIALRNAKSKSSAKPIPEPIKEDIEGPKPLNEVKTQ